VGSIAHDDSLVREAFEELEHGHAGSVSNSILLQVQSGCTTGHERTVACLPLVLHTCIYSSPGTVNKPICLQIPVCY